MLLEGFVIGRRVVGIALVVVFLAVLVSVLIAPWFGLAVAGAGLVYCCLVGSLMVGRSLRGKD